MVQQGADLSFAIAAQRFTLPWAPDRSIRHGHPSHGQNPRLYGLADIPTFFRGTLRLCGGGVGWWWPYGKTWLISTPSSWVSVSGTQPHVLLMITTLVCNPLVCAGFPNSRGLEAFANACWLCLDWVSCQAASQNHKSPWLIVRWGWGQPSLRPTNIGYHWIMNPLGGRLIPLPLATGSFTQRNGF